MTTYQLIDYRADADQILATLVIDGIAHVDAIAIDRDDVNGGWIPMPHCGTDWCDAPVEDYTAVASLIDDNACAAVADQVGWIGQRISAGEGDNRDVGVVAEVRAETAFVCWDQGHSTWTDIEGLEPTSERWSGGHRMS